MLDARGKVVTPGLIDIHVHVYDGVAPLGIPADPNCIAKGVTSAVDAGSSGAHTFPGLRRCVIDVASTRLFALLNISGQSTLSADNPFGELLDLRYANPKLAIRTIEQNRDVILGVKIRMSSHIAGEHDLQALRLAREAADAVRLPIMVHIGGSHSSLADILGMLRKGDVVTHTFKAGPGGIIDESGRILPAVRRAVENGIHTFGFPSGVGTLREGAEADVAVFDLAEGAVASLTVRVGRTRGPGLDVLQREGGPWDSAAVFILHAAQDDSGHDLRARGRRTSHRERDRAEKRAVRAGHGCGFARGVCWQHRLGWCAHYVGRGAAVKNALSASALTASWATREPWPWSDRLSRLLGAERVTVRYVARGET